MSLLTKLLLVSILLFAFLHTTTQIRAESLLTDEEYSNDEEATIVMTSHHSLSSSPSSSSSNQQHSYHTEAADDSLGDVVIDHHSSSLSEVDSTSQSNSAAESETHSESASLTEAENELMNEVDTDVDTESDSSIDTASSSSRGRKKKPRSKAAKKRRAQKRKQKRKQQKKKNKKKQKKKDKKRRKEKKRRKMGKKKKGMSLGSKLALGGGLAAGAGLLGAMAADPEMASKIGGVLSSAGGGVADLAKGGLNAVTSGGVGDALKSAAGGVGDLAGGLGSKIGDLAGGLPGGLSSLGGKLGDLAGGLGGLAAGGLGALKDGGAELLSKIKDAGLMDKLRSGKIGDIMQSLKEGKFGGLTGAIGKGLMKLKGAGGSILGFGKDMLAGALLGCQDEDGRRRKCYPGEKPLFGGRFDNKRRHMRVPRSPPHASPYPEVHANPPIPEFPFPRTAEVSVDPFEDVLEKESGGPVRESLRLLEGKSQVHQDQHALLEQQQEGSDSAALQSESAEPYSTVGDHTILSGGSGVDGPWLPSDSSLPMPGEDQSSVEGFGLVETQLENGQEGRSSVNMRVSPEAVEDCVACRFIWLQVEQEVGNSPIEENIYQAFSTACKDAQDAQIFYPACQDMYAQQDDMIGDYMEGYTVNQLCENARLCR